jgi:hypothetical protein
LTSLRSVLAETRRELLALRQCLARKNHDPGS